jgi:hypothetical protein
VQQQGGQDDGEDCHHIGNFCVYATCYVVAS